MKKIFQKLRCLLLINSDSFLPVPHTSQAVFLHSGLRCIIKIEAFKAFFFLCASVFYHFYLQANRAAPNFRLILNKIIGIALQSTQKGGVVFGAFRGKLNEFNKCKCIKRLGGNNKIEVVAKK